MLVLRNVKADGPRSYACNCQHTNRVPVNGRKSSRAKGKKRRASVIDLTKAVDSNAARPKKARRRRSPPQTIRPQVVTPSNATITPSMHVPRENDTPFLQLHSSYPRWPSAAASDQPGARAQLAVEAAIYMADQEDLYGS